MVKACISVKGWLQCPRCEHPIRIAKPWNHYRLTCSNPPCRTLFAIGLAVWRMELPNGRRESFPPDATLMPRRRKRGGTVYVLASDEQSLESRVKDVGRILGEGDVGEG